MGYPGHAATPHYTYRSVLHVVTCCYWMPLRQLHPRQEFFLQMFLEKPAQKQVTHLALVSIQVVSDTEKGRRSKIRGEWNSTRGCRSDEMIIIA